MIWKRLNPLSNYEISESGEVRNINSKKILVTYNDGRYLKVSLYDNKKRKTYYIHILVAICFLNHKSIKNIIIDHKDKNKLNNHYTNLQIITQRLNVSKDINKAKCSSRFIGVVWKKSHNKWQASIKINGLKKHLGLFNLETDARDAYQKALKSLE